MRNQKKGREHQLIGKARYHPHLTYPVWTWSSCSFACQRCWWRKRWQLCSVKYSFCSQASQVKHPASWQIWNLKKKKERKKEGAGARVHPLLKCQDVINSYKVNMEDFNLCLCQDKDFPMFGSRSLSLYLATFLALSQVLMCSQRCDTPRVTLSSVLFLTARQFL